MPESTRVVRGDTSSDSQSHHHHYGFDDTENRESLDVDDQKPEIWTILILRRQRNCIDGINPLDLWNLNSTNQ